MKKKLSLFLILIMTIICFTGCFSNTNNVEGKIYSGSGLSNVDNEFAEQTIEFKNDHSFVWLVRTPYLSSDWSQILGVYKIEGQQIFLTLRSGQVLVFEIVSSSKIITNVGIELLKQ